MKRLLKPRPAAGRCPIRGAAGGVGCSMAYLLPTFTLGYFCHLAT